VGLAASKGGLQADDGIVGWVCTRQSAQRLVEEKLQPLGGVGILEKGGRILVHAIRFTIHDIREARSKDLLAQLAFQHLWPWVAAIKDRLHRHSSVGASAVGVCCA